MNPRTKVAPQYGCEVAPAGPLQDMAVYDLAAGELHDRRAPLSRFTGGLGNVEGEPGLGGQAVPPGPQSAPVEGV